MLIDGLYETPFHLYSFVNISFNYLRVVVGWVLTYHAEGLDDYPYICKAYRCPKLAEHRQLSIFLLTISIFCVLLDLSIFFFSGKTMLGGPALTLVTRNVSQPTVTIQRPPTLTTPMNNMPLIRVTPGMNCMNQPIQALYPMQRQENLAPFYLVTR